MGASLMRAWRWSWALLAIMVVQPVLGLMFQDEYRDVEWIAATWYGNDWVTLVLVVPIFAAALVVARRGSARAVLVWFGLLGYGAYNYAYYLLGAALNVFFLLYAAGVVLSVVSLVLALSAVDAKQIAGAFRPGTPVRLLGGYLVFVAVGLTLVWIGTWAAYAFAGRPTPIEPEAFKLVAALDITIMVTALATGGVLLWRRNRWGYIVATIASVQGGLYLLVLCVNSGIAIARGLAEAPGELVIWGPLAFFTSAAAVALIASARGHLGSRASSA